MLACASIEFWAHRRRTLAVLASRELLQQSSPSEKTHTMIFAKKKHTLMAFFGGDH